MSAHRTINDLSLALVSEAGISGTDNAGQIIAAFNGVPTASAVGYAKGCIAIDVANGKQYTNTGDATSATWTVTGTQS